MPDCDKACECLRDFDHLEKELHITRVKLEAALDGQVHTIPGICGDDGRVRYTREEITRAANRNPHAIYEIKRELHEMLRQCLADLERADEGWSRSIAGWNECAGQWQSAVKELERIKGMTSDT